MRLPDLYLGSRLPDDFESSSLEYLVPEFCGVAQKLISNLTLKGIRMVPYSTLRGPKKQGEMWCRSRSVSEVGYQKSLILASGAEALASYLDVQLAEKGRWSTSALPGQSWHQWGFAIDCFNQVGGAAIWNGSGFEAYAAEAKSLGLTAGYHWCPGRDHVHVQRSSLINPMFAESSTFLELEKKLSRIYTIPGYPDA